LFPADANNAHRATSWRSRNCDDGVVVVGKQGNVCLKLG
jgi:hypothetical protein